MSGHDRPGLLAPIGRALTRAAHIRPVNSFWNDSSALLVRASRGCGPEWVSPGGWKPLLGDGMGWEGLILLRPDAAAASRESHN